MSYELLPSVDVPLKSGARSTAVVELQTLLRQNGFYADAPDGVVGPKTFAAVYGMWTALAASPSQSARDLVAGSYTNLTVGQVFSRLSSALREHNAYDRALGGGRLGSSPTPTYRDGEIVFTPDMLAQGMGGDAPEGSPTSSTSPAVWAIGIGLGLAVVGLAVSASRSAR